MQIVLLIGVEFKLFEDSFGFLSEKVTLIYKCFSDFILVLFVLESTDPNLAG